MGQRRRGEALNPGATQERADVGRLAGLPCAGVRSGKARVTTDGAREPILRVSPSVEGEDGRPDDRFSALRTREPLRPVTQSP